MDNKKTIKALEELARSEYWTASALDAARTDAQDDNLRRNYRKWRDAHLKEAEALNKRIEELGGHATRYEFGEDHQDFWTRLTAPHDYKSLAGIRIVAERGIKQYADHVDKIDDPRTLAILRKNLGAKRKEIRWYDDQAEKEHKSEVKAELEKSKTAVKTLEKEIKKEKNGSKRGAPWALLAAAGLAGTAAYVVTRRNGEKEGDDFDDLFKYDAGETPAPAETKVGV